MNEIFYISRLIIKKKIKGLEDSEKALLKEYYEKYPFSKRVDFEDVVQKISEYPTINKEKAWESILSKSNKTLYKTSTPLIKRDWFKYAVAAVIVLLISIPFLIKKIDKNPIEPPTIVKTNTVIKKGTDKATLTLEDGSNIVLKKGQSYITGNVESNGEKIVYKSANKAQDKPVIKYNYLTIPRGGQYFIELEDGSQVWLNSESKLKFPVAFIKGQKRKVELIYGEAYFDISPSEHHEGASFKVLSDGQEIEVLGTEFNVKAYKDETYVYTTLVEGKVAVDNKVNKTILSPNEQSVLSKGNKSIIISEVDVFTEISWKDGFFSFRSKSLKDIMKVLSRWYDVDVLFLDKTMEGIKFKGVLNKNQNLEEILTIIKKTNYINAYDINEKTVLIK